MARRAPELVDPNIDPVAYLLELRRWALSPASLPAPTKFFPRVNLDMIHGTDRLDPARVCKFADMALEVRTQAFLRVEHALKVFGTAKRSPELRAGQRPAIILFAQWNARKTLEVSWAPLPRPGAAQDGGRHVADDFDVYVHTFIYRDDPIDTLFRLVDGTDYYASLSTTSRKGELLGSPVAAVDSAIQDSLQLLIVSLSCVCEVGIANWINFDEDRALRSNSPVSRLRARVKAEADQARECAQGLVKDAQALLARMELTSRQQLHDLYEQAAARGVVPSSVMFELTGRRTSSLQLDKAMRAVEAADVADRRVAAMETTEALAAKVPPYSGADYQLARSQDPPADAADARN